MVRATSHRPGLGALGIRVHSGNRVPLRFASQRWCCLWGCGGGKLELLRVVGWAVRGLMEAEDLGTWGLVSEPGVSSGWRLVSTTPGPRVGQAAGRRCGLGPCGGAALAGGGVLAEHRAPRGPPLQVSGSRAGGARHCWLAPSWLWACLPERGHFCMSAPCPVPGPSSEASRRPGRLTAGLGGSWDLGGRAESQEWPRETPADPDLRDSQPDCPRLRLRQCPWEPPLWPAAERLWAGAGVSAETQFCPERCGQGFAEGPLTSGFVAPPWGLRWGWGPLRPARPRRASRAGGSPRRGLRLGPPATLLCTPGQGGSGQGADPAWGGLAAAAGARLVEEEPADKESYLPGTLGGEGAEVGSVGQVGTHASILLGTLSSCSAGLRHLPSGTRLPRCAQARVRRGGCSDGWAGMPAQQYQERPC